MRFKIADNIEQFPGNNGNAYSASKILYNNIRVDKSKIIASSNEIEEVLDFEFGNNSKGGMIIFSTDINALELSDKKVINWIKQKITTIKNRINSTKTIDAIAQKNNLIGWTIGHFLNGRYTSKKGTPYGENSLSVEVVGISTEVLINIATDICREFIQEDVLVKDYNTGKVYFVNRD